MNKLAQRSANTLPARSRLCCCLAHLAQLNLRHHTQDVVFAGEVIKEGPLPHVGGFGDVFDGHIRKAMLGNQFQGASEEPDARLCGAALPPSDPGRRGDDPTA
jgi:hypothetical protein